MELLARGLRTHWGCGRGGSLEILTAPARSGLSLGRVSGAGAGPALPSPHGRLSHPPQAAGPGPPGTSPPAARRERDGVLETLRGSRSWAGLRAPQGAAGSGLGTALPKGGGGGTVPSPGGGQRAGAGLGWAGGGAGGFPCNGAPSSSWGCPGAWCASCPGHCAWGDRRDPDCQQASTSREGEPLKAQPRWGRLASGQ